MQKRQRGGDQCGLGLSFLSEEKAGIAAGECADQSNQKSGIFTGDHTMIKSLRKNFILVAMGSTFVVLMAIMGIMLLSNYFKTMERADQLLHMLAENEGEFPRELENMRKLDEEESIPMRRKNDRPKDWTEETPYETRFFLSCWIRI